MAERMALADFLVSWQPGSHDDAWTWADEARDLWDREPTSMRALVDDIRTNGQQTPVTLGDDGRVWDGHHRVVALEALGEQWVNVRHWDDLSADEQMDALVESAGDWEMRTWQETAS